MAKLKWGMPGLKWNQPGLLWGGDAPTQIQKMNTVVLSLDELTDSELLAEGRRIAGGLTDNAAAFTGVAPTPAQIITAADAFEGGITTATQRRQESEAATLAKDNLAEALRTALTKAATCDAVKAVSPEVCTLVFTLKSAPVPTTSMPKVTTVTISFGDKTTELDIMWAPVPKARAYEIQYKTATGAWTPAKTATRSSVTVAGLPAGQLVQIRIRAIGPNDLEGEWSDPTEHLVP
jgi:hypothetical protein